jgi:hypothetical protein
MVDRRRHPAHPTPVVTVVGCSAYPKRSRLSCDSLRGPLSLAISITSLGCQPPRPADACRARGGSPACHPVHWGVQEIRLLGRVPRFVSLYTRTLSRVPSSAHVVAPPPGSDRSRWAHLSCVEQRRSLGRSLTGHLPPAIWGARHSPRGVGPIAKPPVQFLEIFVGAGVATLSIAARVMSFISTASSALITEATEFRACPSFLVFPRKSPIDSIV